VVVFFFHGEGGGGGSGTNRGTFQNDELTYHISMKRDLTKTKDINGSKNGYGTQCILA